MSGWSPPLAPSAPAAAGDDEAGGGLGALAALRIGSSSGSSHADSPAVKSYSAFGGGAFGEGLFFQQQSVFGNSSSGGGGGGSGWGSPQQPLQQQQQHVPQRSIHPPMQHGYPGQQPLPVRNLQSEFSQGFGAASMHLQQQPSHSQSHSQERGAFDRFNQGGGGQTLQQQHPQQLGGSKSIFNEVMSMMQPQTTSQQQPPMQQQLPQHMQPPHGGFPTGQRHPPFAQPQIQQQQQLQHQQPPPGMRPPLMQQAAIGPPRGPPGFKAPPGFSPPLQQQPHQQAQMGAFASNSSNNANGMSPFIQQQQQPQLSHQPPPHAHASPLPGALQHDSHVQCSMCRVVVLNTPQALYMHDHSPQHIHNEQRAQQMKMQQQQQQQQHLSGPLQHPPGMLASASVSAVPSPASSSSSPASASASASPLLDLNELQNQLRSFMRAQEDARARGLPPLTMEPSLLKMVTEMQQRMAAVQQQQQQQSQQGGGGAAGGPTAGAHDDKSTDKSSKPPPDPATLALQARTASNGHVYPSREALIAATAEVHLCPLKRMQGGRQQRGHGGMSAKVAKFLPPRPAELEHDLHQLLSTLQSEHAPSSSSSSSAPSHTSTSAVRENIRAECERIAQAHWGANRCSVKLFGSSVNTLCDARSDVDLCLIIHPEAGAAASEEVDKSAIVAELANLLTPVMSSVLALPKARVPIVKFVAPPESGSLACDLGINNVLAVRNSELIRDYMTLDSRARDLCLLVKHWAKSRKINDTFRGTLSSYAYVLMVIQFLQLVEVLPCLQTLGRRRAGPEQEDAPVLINGFDTWYQTNLSLARSVLRESSGSSWSLAELLGGFFRMYATEFDFKEQVISPRVGHLLDKKKKLWGISGKKDRHLICVEDVFDTTHNLGRGVDPAALYEIRGEFMRAYSMIKEGAASKDVCSPYTKAWREDRGQQPQQPQQQQQQQ